MARWQKNFAPVLAGVVAAAGAAACSSSPHLRGGPVRRPPDVQGPATTAPVGPVGPVAWQACSGSAGPAHFQCATVSVPRDPKDPSKGSIAMALDRRPATGARIGSLLVNPGGPGASGVDALPTLVAAMPDALLSRFDVVGFDPPGVARTAPITCLDGAGLEAYYHADPEPQTQPGIDALIESDRAFSKGCQARSGTELPFVSTVDAAMDMDVVRGALGDQKLTYMGFSYGTLLGATYADIFPGRVRAMVLDGALDPTLPVITGLDEQAAGLDDQLRQFFAWCKPETCAWKPAGDPAAAYSALLARVRTDQLKVPGTSRTVGPAEFLYGTAVTLYDTTTWKALGYALQGAAKGDGTYFLEFFDAYTGRQSDGSYNNLFEANSAINCLDARAPSIAAIEAAMPAAEAAAPIFGPQNLNSELTCSVWPIPPTADAGPLKAPGAPPIVVVGSTGDPITPYPWAQSLASQLHSGVLLTRVGDGHTGYRASSCIRSTVDSYLISLAVPPAGTRCASD